MSFEKFINMTFIHKAKLISGLMHSPFTETQTMFNLPNPIGGDIVLYGFIALFTKINT